MAQKTVNLDTLTKLRRWVGRSLGHTVSLYEVLQWLEEHPDGMSLKSSVAHVVIRDTSAGGTPEELRKLHELGYDLAAKCTHQVDGNALHAAVQFGKKANALALLEMGLDPRQRLYPTGPSALDEAIINGHLKLFQVLRSKSSGETTDQDRESFLKSALSRKTRKKSWDADKLKNDVLAFVLEHFGPFNPEQLNQALAMAAQQGKEKCFATLVEAGADPSIPCVLIHSQYHGRGNLMLELLSRVAPARWVPILAQHGHNEAWFFPASSASETPLTAANLVWLHEQVSRNRPSVLHPEIEESIGAIQARARQKGLNQVLQEPQSPKPGRPRF